ncbi:hypothetical protein BS330_27185 [Amycolatopsis keratiniphila subsp. nogabecina]|nr:hypothetical protein BS330_27185 [Amycolatopsis keratiniphila subsp. nogabecina]
MTCSIRDLASMPLAGCEPVRRFSWRRGQRHRLGLQYLVSTGRLHGFESLAATQGDHGAAPLLRTPEHHERARASEPHRRSSATSHRRASTWWSERHPILASNSLTLAVTLDNRTMPR